MKELRESLYEPSSTSAPNFKFELRIVPKFQNGLIIAFFALPFIFSKSPEVLSPYLYVGEKYSFHSKPE